MGLAEVFAEERSFPVQHIFIPATIYYYTQNIYQFYTIIYLFETFEYLLGQIDTRWSEDPGNSLFSDILMATLGMLAVSQFAYKRKPLWYVSVHLLTLIGASIATVEMWDEIMVAYVLFGVVASIIGTLISTEWAVFSAVNFGLIAGLQNSYHTPTAAIISILTTTALITAYKRCIQES